MNKQTLASYYENLPSGNPPKTEFVNKMIEKCNVTDATVRNWVKGNSIPQNPEHLQILSEETGIPIENLFTE